jgi:hypothetical protein
MAIETIITIPVHLTRGEAMALVQFCKRIDAETVHSFASPSTSHGDRPEADVRWPDVLTLQGAPAGSGFMAPRQGGRHLPPEE